MADTVAPSQRASGGGFFGKVKATLKRITPGEWALIALGVAALVVYVIWYQNQQQSTGTTSTTNPNPNWQDAQAQPNGTFAGELADLLSSIAGQGTVPGTAAGNNAGGASASDGGSAASGGIAGGAAGTGMAPQNTGQGLVAAAASSGSGLGNTNSSPVKSLSQFLSGGPSAESASVLSGQHKVTYNPASLPGTVAAPVTSPVTGATVNAPVNVAPNNSGVGQPTATVGASQGQNPPVSVINYAAAVQAASASPVTHASTPVSYASVTKPSVSVTANYSHAAATPAPSSSTPNVAKALTSRLGR